VAQAIALDHAGIPAAIDHVAMKPAWAEKPPCPGKRDMVRRAGCPLAQEAVKNKQIAGRY